VPASPIRTQSMRTVVGQRCHRYSTPAVGSSGSGTAVSGEPTTGWPTMVTVATTATDCAPAGRGKAISCAPVTDIATRSQLTILDRLISASPGSGGPREVCMTDTSPPALGKEDAHRYRS
jgi:hypothetical protein